MIEIGGYRFPPGLLYDVPHHTWYRREADGTIRLGLDMVAVALAGPVLAYTPKRVGLGFEAGRSCAVLESGKWVGPVRACFAGVVVAVNEPMIARPSIVNADCYNEGWITVARAADAAALDGLVSGNALEAAYRAWMAANELPPPPA